MLDTQAHDYACITISSSVTNGAFIEKKNYCSFLGQIIAISSLCRDLDLVQINPICSQG